MKYKTIVLAVAVSLCALAGVLDAARSAAQPEITLERIMADPDWIGAPVKNAYWSVDGRAAYYSVKRSGSPITELHRVDTGDRRDRIVDAQAMAGADSPAVFDAAGKRAAFVRNDDIFVRDVASGRLTQITRTAAKEAAPQFSADGGLLSFRAGNDWFVHDFGTGVTAPAAIIKAENDPDAPPKAGGIRPTCGLGSAKARPGC